MSYTPEVYISTRNNRLKVYSNNTIYMESGTEFQLEFINNNFITHKADILINGKKQRSGLVLNPYSHIYLERFIDDNKKFKFDVYDVDNNEAVKEIIKSNGLIEVRFYEEIIEQTLHYTPIEYFKTGSPSYTYTDGTTYGNYYQSTITTSSPVNTRGIICDSATGTTIAGAAMGASTNKLNHLKNTSTLETGRVAQGNTSTQELIEIQKKFNPVSNCIIKYKILPISQMPQENVTIKDIRTYCQSCGRRMKKGWNHCPGCGTKN